MVSEQLIEVLKRFGNSFVHFQLNMYGSQLFDKSQGRTNNKRPFLLLVTLILLIAYYVLMTAGQNLLPKAVLQFGRFYASIRLPFLGLWVTLILISKNRLNYFYYFQPLLLNLFGKKPLTNSNICKNTSTTRKSQINYGHYLVLSSFQSY